MPDVGQAACTPVNAAFALHQLFVDEVAAKCREVWMATRDDAVDIGLVVAAAGLELLDQPPQNGEPFLALPRDADEATRGIDEVLAQTEVVVRVRRRRQSTLPPAAP